MIKVLKEPENTNYFQNTPENKEIYNLFKSDRLTYFKIAESSMTGHAQKNLGN